MTEEFLEQNSSETTRTHTYKLEYTLYNLPIEGTTKKEVIISIPKRNIIQKLGEVFNDEENGIHKGIICDNNTICFFKKENSIRTIERIFYIPTLTMIEGSEETLEETFYLLLGINFNDWDNFQLREEKPQVRKLNLQDNTYN